MMKKFFLAVAVSAICSGAFAQKDNGTKFHFSVGPEVGFAVGGFNDTHSVGIGATIAAGFNIAPSTDFTINSGLLSYAGRSVSSGIKYKSQVIVPLKAGLKYFLSEGFYAEGQVGAGFLSNYGTGVAFAYSPVLGYEFSTKSGKAVDAAFKYDGYSKNGGSIGAINFRLAYRF
ncbi:hypothetical protein [Ferruginibacter sp.]